MKYFFMSFIFLLTVFFSPLLRAEEPIVFPKNHGSHLAQTMEVWMFTGEAETEEGNKYAYMFQLRRDNDTMSVFANIVDLATQKQVLQYKHKNQKPFLKKESKDSDEPMSWKVGKAFVKYDPISDSWIFGVLDDKNSFNFRVKGVRNYVLNGKEGYLVQEKGTKNFQASYSAQSMNMNGHLTLEGKSSFVTGKNSWFEHRWGTALSRHNATKYALITCRFNDNTGLMLYEWFGSKEFWPERLKTGTYQNAFDEKVLLSNFSLTKLMSRTAKTNQWRISIPALKMNISASGDVIPGYDAKYNIVHIKNNKEGYCFLSEKGF